MADVILIPTGHSYDYVVKHGVYLCPDAKGYHHHMCRFYAFRPNQSDITELFTLKAHYVLPASIDAIRESDIPEEEKTKIVAYLEETMPTGIHPEIGTGSPTQFFILKDRIQLPTPVRSAKQWGSGCTYYNLADMIDPETAVAILPATQVE